MAIAPVNKFISIAVPVAPGLQKLYEVPTGASALILYAQVANVGIGTFPRSILILIFFKHECLVKRYN